MEPKSRIDIIVGKLKPMADKPSMKKERKDPMQSDDFVQEIDMDEDAMALEACGEEILAAVKQSDAKALAEAICHLMEVHCHHCDEDESDEAELDSEY